MSGRVSGRKIPALCLLLWGGMLVACNDPVEVERRDALSAGESPIQTDSLAYTLVHRPGAYDATAIAHYVNRGSEPVHFARCMPDSDGPIHGIGRVAPDTAWQFVGVVWGCVGGVPTGAVAPGDSLVVEVWLGSTESPYANPPITMEARTGRFRIVFELCAGHEADSDDCERLPLEQRQSNIFEIRPPE